MQEVILQVLAADSEIPHLNLQNFSFLVHELVTPPLEGLILPGVTRASILEMARNWQHEPSKDPMHVSFKHTWAIRKRNVILFLFSRLLNVELQCQRWQMQQRMVVCLRSSAQALPVRCVQSSRFITWTILLMFPLEILLSGMSTSRTEHNIVICRFCDEILRLINQFCGRAFCYFRDN